MAARVASHAGFWYSNQSEILEQDLSNWLEEVELHGHPARAIIAPHATYNFSGQCAAYAYQQINPVLIKRVFIIAPSHYKSLNFCALTQTVQHETPLYNLSIDTKVNDELLSTGLFELLPLEDDEKEHSVEMHLPFLAKIMKNYANEFSIVPILVGRVSTKERKEQYGRIFSTYLANPQNLFIISSDFCHWGKRFNYTPRNITANGTTFNDHIEYLDKLGMNIIENLDPEGFETYLDDYRNTICGRMPILLFLYAIKALQYKEVEKPMLEFLNYKQSNTNCTIDDSSVSYAAAYLYFKN